MIQRPYRRILLNNFLVACLSIAARAAFSQEFDSRDHERAQHISAAMRGVRETVAASREKRCGDLQRFNDPGVARGMAEMTARLPEHVRIALSFVKGVREVGNVAVGGGPMRFHSAGTAVAAAVVGFADRRCSAAIRMADYRVNRGDLAGNLRFSVLFEDCRSMATGGQVNAAVSSAHVYMTHEGRLLRLRASNDGTVVQKYQSQDLRMPCYSIEDSDWNY